MNRPIIKNKIIRDDDWHYLSEDDALPHDGNIIMNYQRWQCDKNALSDFSGKRGVSIECDTPLDELKDNLATLDLIAIRFEEFKDGRGYSLARLLRERYGFRGELRAIGNVLRDQIYYLHRCGFDAFELDEGRDLQEAVGAFSDFHVSYQPVADV